MEEKLDNTLEELINSFNEDEDFQEYFRIREKVKNNKEIMELVEKVKKLQKELVKIGSEDVQKELDIVLSKLDSIPLYDTYNKKLAIANQKNELLVREVNNFFQSVVNNKN